MLTCLYKSIEKIPQPFTKGDIVKRRIKVSRFVGCFVHIFVIFALIPQNPVLVEWFSQSGWSKLGDI